MSGISPAVVVASADHQLLDEVIRSLEELPHWRLVATASDLSELSSRCDPSVQVVLCDAAIAKAWADSGGPLGIGVIVVFDRASDPANLLAAIELQAKGFVEWPNQRHRLRDLVDRSLSGSVRVRPVGGKIVGVWSAKGGAGTSTIAAHLAVALVPQGSTILVDLDIENADQTAVFGAESHKKHSGDLLRVLDEMSAPMIESVAFRHPSGLGVILSPGALGSGDMIKPADKVKLVGSLAETSAYLVADLPSADLESAQSLLEIASHFYLVVTPDLLSLKRARDAVKTIRGSGARLDGAKVILNQYVRQDVSVAQVEALTGLKVACTVRPDLGISRAAGRGEPEQSAARLLKDLVSDVSGLQPPRKRASLIRR